MAKEAVLDDQSIRNTLVAAVGELIGTLLLVYVGTQTAVTVVLAAPFAGQPLGSLSVALAFGATLAVLVYVIGPITGGHFNPIVSIGMAVLGEISGRTLAVYVSAQFIGSVLGSVLVLSLNEPTALAVASLGVTQPAPGIDAVQLTGFEGLGSFILLFTVTAMVTGKRVEKSVNGLIVGFSLFLAIVTTGPYTGGGINPFRTVAPMIVSGRVDDVLFYIVGQLAGGFLGIAAFKLISKATVPTR